MVTWSGLDALGPFSYVPFQVMLGVPVGMAFGTDLDATLTIAQDSVETSVENNTASHSQLVTGSYDPNDKVVWPREFYHLENDSILDYTIRFQDTGTDTAFTVVVSDTLPLDVDTRTFEIGAASHPYTYSLTGNGILTFTFDDILLPDSNTNEPLSHGLINFRIKPILPLTLGQEITNAADIYFDFNPPVHTNDASVIVTDETGVRPVVKPEKLTVFPVPVKNMLTAILPENFKPVQAWAVGVDARQIPMLLPSQVQAQLQLPTRHLASGAYVLTLVDRAGKRLSARFTKE